ncbi:hypothetical protein, partial [Escherichia coli]|uniref:hypothetical protein n=1 Tax=Escherichia coli TaxID=562 RepID=UPI001A7EFF1A
VVLVFFGGIAGTVGVRMQERTASGWITLDGASRELFPAILDLTCKFMNKLLVYCGICLGHVWDRNVCFGTFWGMVGTL